jgi:hypothetical protein
VTIAPVQSAVGTSEIQDVSAAFDVATTTGNLLILSISGNNIVSGTPDGWELSAGMSQVGNNGGYTYWRISEGETSFPYSLAGNDRSSWIISEFSGVDPVPYDVSSGQHNSFGTGEYTTPDIIPSVGNVLVYAAFPISSALDITGTWTAWQNSFIEITHIGQNLGSGTNTGISAAYSLLTGDGSTPVSTGVHLPAVSTGTVGEIIAFKEAVGGDETVFDAEGGSYSYTGSDAAFSIKLAAGSGSYALNGADAAFAIKLVAEAGSYTYSGASAAFRFKLVAAAGSYTLTGSSATFVGAEVVEPSIERTFKVKTEKRTFDISKETRVFVVR